MRRKSERTVKASPTKKAENTPRRTSRRTRKTPEKSINDEESENNSSDQGSNSDNDAEEVVAPKRSRRLSRTIEKSSSAEDLKPTTRPRRKAAAKKEADTIEEDPNEGDQSTAVDTQSKNENNEIEEKPVESLSTDNVGSASVDSSNEPTVANDDQADKNEEKNEITQTTDKIECPEEKQHHDTGKTEIVTAVTDKEEETPVQSTQPEADEMQQEAPKEKPTRRRALKRAEKEPVIADDKVVAVNESETNENVKETTVDDEAPTEPKPEQDSESNENTEETKIKTDSPQQSESVEEEPKENGQAKVEETKVTKKQPIVRKRKWLSNKASAPKVQEITISTDSLKGLISDVKPVPLSDVKLESSPEADHESDDVKVVSSTSLDYNNRRSEERVSESADDAINITTTRKISIVSEPDDQQPLSPAKHNPCNILFITNLVRPFTVLQLKSLLQRTGKIDENGFWMDKIKSKCFVKYETEDEAVETRHALHGIRWPSSNPKFLNVDFGTESLMEKAIESTAGDIKTFSTSRDERVVSSNDLHESNRERIAAERPVREWDLGKKSDLRRSRERDRTDKDHDMGKASREKDRDRRRRSASASPSRKYPKKEAEPPLRLLDDLFRKTKTTPCIYWLPLTPEQIAVREEERQKTIQRRLAMKKEREREEIEEKERRRQREKRNSPDRDRDRRPVRENSRDRNRRDRPNDRRRY